MKTNRSIANWAGLFSFAALTVQLAAVPLGTAFTYQGKLTSGMNAANGVYDFVFGVFNAPSGGLLQGGPVTLLAVPVTNGYFMVTLDFGNAFNGDARWLDISVKTNNGSGYTTLTPRQQLTPAPYSLFASNSATLGGQFPSYYAPASGSTAYVAKSGDTMTGALNLPANGLVVGTSQLVLSGGRVGIGTMSPQAPLEVNGNVKADGDLMATRLNVGTGHTLTGTSATIAGGSGNTASGAGTVVGGGANNSASSNEATVSGGWGNGATGFGATVGGGEVDIAGGSYATVAGGVHNAASRDYATVGGGYYNTASGSSATVGGGYQNAASGPGASVAGGSNNTASAMFAAIGGGNYNSANANNSIVAGGANNHALGDRSAVGGGGGNAATNYCSTVAGGSGNLAGGDSAAVGGGEHNRASGPGSTVGGGGWDGATSAGNLASGNASTVAGGLGNSAGGNTSAIGGGQNNGASGVSATVAGGLMNTASGNDATIAGGDQNTASAFGAMVPGGWLCVASGNTSFAAGTRAKASRNGAFVWADSLMLDYDPVIYPQPGGIQDSFNVRAQGGVYFATAVNGTSGQPTAGMYLGAGGSGWNAYCDRNGKTNFQDLDGRDVLDRLMSIPIQAWNYKTQDESVRHLGPMARDFNAAFGTGEADKVGEKNYINSVDADGVALAAIQGLNQKLEEKEVRIRELERTVNELKTMVQTLAGKANGGTQ